MTQPPKQKENIMHTHLKIADIQKTGATSFDIEKARERFGEEVVCSPENLAELPSLVDIEDLTILLDSVSLKEFQIGEQRRDTELTALELRQQEELAAFEAKCDAEQAQDWARLYTETARRATEGI
jgi:hypothetical protein